MKQSRLAISAVAGSFTEEAARFYQNKIHEVANFNYVGTAHSAFKSVAIGESDFGIIPIRNSNAGFVVENLKASADYLFRVVHVFSIPVRQNFLVRPGVTSKEITQITSQLPALAQCGDYLEQNWPSTPLTEYIDTALAARDLSSGKLSQTTAVIASRSAAELYHLDLLAADIQTDKDNYTDFMVIAPHS